MPPVVLILVLLLGLASQVPAVRRSLASSTSLQAAAALALSVYFAAPPNEPRVTWPVIALFWGSLLWKMLVDSAWRGYIDVRSRSGRFAEPLPDAERLLMLPRGVVPMLLGAVAGPLFVWLFARDLADKMTAGGFRVDPMLQRMPLAAIGGSVFMMLMVVSIFFINRNKNRWLAVQMRLLKAAVTVGDVRQEQLTRAVDEEPPPDPSAHLTSASS